MAVPKINLEELALDKLIHHLLVLEIDESLQDKIVLSFFEVNFDPRPTKQRIHACYVDRKQFWQYLKNSNQIPFKGFHNIGQYFMIFEAEDERKLTKHGSQLRYRRCSLPIYQQVP